MVARGRARSALAGGSLTQAHFSAVACGHPRWGDRCPCSTVFAAGLSAICRAPSAIVARAAATAVL
eukprot:9779926-Lingulodinium_polyedra.AAC.1